MLQAISEVETGVTQTLTRLLIVNADDFGLNASATDGIIECHAAGSVASTTLMVNAPDAQRAVLLASQHPALGVGLHFNLTWGEPVSPPGKISALVDGDGRFFDRNALARRLLLGRVPARQVQIELEAQLARMSEFGLRATHIDSHQHVHGFGVVFDAVASQCETRSLPMRVPWVPEAKGGSPARRLRRALLAHMLGSATQRWRDRVRWNDGMGSVFDLGATGAAVGDADYRRLLQSAPPGAYELMVHPVTSGDAMQGYTRIGAVAEAEWRYLRSGRLVEVAREAGFRMGTFRDLAG